MTIRQEEKIVIETVARLLQQDAHYYNKWIEKGASLPRIAEEVQEDARQKRVKNEIDRQTYEQYRNMMRDLIVKYEYRQARESFLAEPKSKIEQKLEEKTGVSFAKMNASKFLLVFKDGEELEIDFDEHNGLLIRMGKDYYSPDEE